MKLSLGAARGLVTALALAVGSFGVVTAAHADYYWNGGHYHHRHWGCDYHHHHCHYRYY
jgi:hypothetical protein